MLSKSHQGGRSNRWRFCAATITGLSFIANVFADTAPVITTQPQDQSVAAGNNVVLSVAATTGSAAPSLPSVSSGTLNLWLRADAGVVTNGTGQVSMWQDQSGNSNDASQTNPNIQPQMVYPSGIGGRAAVRFNGIQDGVNGDYLQGAGDVGVPNAMTAFVMYDAFSLTNSFYSVWLTGVPGAVFGASRGYTIYHGDMDFTTWSYDSLTSFAVPTNSYRICTDRVNPDLSEVQLFDTSATDETDFTETMSGAVTPAAGYYVGGLNPSVPSVSPPYYNFAGDVAELIIYNGYLSDADRLAVQSYLQEKYYLIGNSNGLAFQWTFDSTNIAGATNATLTLTDVTTAESGYYSVVVTDTSGSTISSNAVITVESAPGCVSAPQGLVGWWPAEGNADDIAGGNNGALINGASFGPGKVGEAFDLNGFNQYIAIPDAPALRPASLTAEGWYNFQADDGLRVLVAKPYGPGTLDSFAVWIQNGQLDSEISTATNEPAMSYNWFPAFGVWHHVAFTYDTHAAMQTLYVDGVAVVSNSASGPIVYDTHPFQIGADIENGRPSFFFDGSIDEVSLYNRALSGAEIAAIYDAGSSGKCPLPAKILVEPQSQNAPTESTVAFSVTAAGTPPLAYQWRENGTIIPGATNSALVLTNVHSTADGTYTVIVTNDLAKVTSSNAYLTVGAPAPITSNPFSRTINAGGNVTFSVDAGGTQPFTYQWYFNGAALPGETSPTLTVTDVQATNVGDYHATVSNLFGSAISSNAVLTVEVKPVIVTQPQGQIVGLGSNVTLSVSVAGGASSLPAVSSGTLQLWLKADVGAVTNAAGLVSEWQDQSGNTNNAFQTNAVYQPLLVNPAEIGGRAALRFNGTPGNINYLAGSGDVGVTNAMTSFVLVDEFSTLLYQNMVWLIGYPATVYGGSRSDVGYLGRRSFTTWFYGYQAPFVLPTNTYRIWTDRVSADLTTLDLFDTTASGSTNWTAAMPTAYPPAPGYYVGGIDPSLPYVSGWNMNGDIAEWIVYKGYLSDADRLAVQAYLQQKYYQSGETTNGDTFQWKFDGTNIVGATNSTLTLTNYQTTEAGTYTVTVTDLVGSTTSSNAVLTTLDRTTVEVVNTSAAGGSTVVVPIDLIAQGTESGVGLTLDFDPSVLTFTGAVLGSGASGGALLVNTNQAASGHLGLEMALPTGTFSVGVQDVFDVSFQVAFLTNAASTSLTFGGGQVSDSQANPVPAVFLPGTVAIAPAPIAGDVSPRPNGDEVVNIDDWVQEGRFVAGLDIVSNGTEYQRADCAPRGAPSGGPITTADWVQVGRYAVGLDPVTLASGPTSPVTLLKDSALPSKDDVSRPMTLVPLSQETPTSSVAVELTAQGNESALQFSVTFNPAMVQFVSAGLGSGASGAVLIQNTGEAASGNLGFVVGFLAPATFASGTQQIVKLNFAPVGYSNNMAVAFGDTPVPRQLVDANSEVLQATYENATLAVSGLAWPPMSISQSGRSVVLSWPSSGAVFGVQSAPSLEGPWSNVAATPATIGNSVVITSPVTNNTVYYRLKY